MENKPSISPDSFYEIIHEDGDLISYEQEKLDKLLHSIIIEIKPTPELEKETKEKIQKAVEITEDIFSTIDRFIEDATLAENNIL